MKKLLKWGALVLILGALGILPFRGTDVAELLPVRTVIVSRAGAEYEVDVGAGVKAAGSTLHEALENLRRRVSGTVFYRTAEQVVITEQAQDVLEQVVAEPAFRPAAELYLTPDTALDAKAVSEYLSAHSGGVTITEAKARLSREEAPGLPELRRTGGGFEIRPE